MKRLSNWMLFLLGWKIKGQYPEAKEVPKAVVIVIPHTSNWDFPLGLLVRSAIAADIKFVAKSSLFRPPFGWLFRWLGGYPVERSRRTNFVQSMVEVFKAEEQLHVVIAPEGTRSKVDRLRTGFYYIAKGAGVPIVMCRLDWGSKTITFSEPLQPTDDLEADFKTIEAFFKGARGKIPQQGYLYEG